MKDGYEPLGSYPNTDDSNTKATKPSFDLASWLQQGSMCRNPCYNQVYSEVRHVRAASVSSNTFSTEDTSSLNDSFDDPTPIESKDSTCWKSSWTQNQEGKSFQCICYCLCH